jgi:hypothetical protein
MALSAIVAASSCGGLRFAKHVKSLFRLHYQASRATSRKLS